MRCPTRIRVTLHYTACAMLEIQWSNLYYTVTHNQITELGELLIILCER